MTHHWKIRSLGGVALLVACTYGPPRTDVRITNHALAPTGPGAAFAVYAIRYRPPTGISTFPDGGTPLVLAEGAAVYTCDTLTRAVHQVWRAPRPAAIRSGFTPWLGPWTAAGIFASVRGYATTTTVPAAFVRVNYLIRPGVGIDSGVTEPPLGAATSEPAGCARAVLDQARADPPSGS